MNFLRCVWFPTELGVPFWGQTFQAILADGNSWWFILKFYEREKDGKRIYKDCHVGDLPHIDLNRLHHQSQPN